MTLNTDWDPYEELMLHKHNIEQLVLAITHGSEIMKDMGHKYAHQQEIISQLVTQNQRLNDLMKQTRLEISRVNTELIMLKQRLNQSQ
jgi:hypothetical protein